MPPAEGYILWNLCYQIAGQINTRNICVKSYKIRWKTSHEIEEHALKSASKYLKTERDR